MSDSHDTHDSELDQALQRAREAAPAGAAPNKLTLGLAAAVLLGAGFFGGYVVGGHGDDPRGGFGRMDQRGPMGPGGPGGGPDGPMNLTMGTISSISGDTVTVKTQDGKTVKVKITDDTDVRVNNKGTVKDLKKGASIVANGERDGDTIAADHVASGMELRGPRMNRNGG